MRALLAVPPIEDLYPYASLTRGLAASGCEIVQDETRADLLVTWSPWLNSHRHALQRKFDANGRFVICAENGYLSPIRDRRFYQLAFGGWNGTGVFREGGPDRWASWGIEPQPWKTDDTGVALVIGQRGHPSDPRTAIPGWHERVPIDHPRVRRRPRDCAFPLSAEIAGASVMHTWSSNAASWAVIAGVPVVQHGPTLMVSELASRPGEPLVRPERKPVLERLAWAQWDLSEIESGEAFSWLLWK